MLSEEPFKNHRFDMTDKKDDYTMYDYVSHYFGITIGKHGHVLLVMPQKKKSINDDSFMFPLKEISQKEKKMRPISHDKKTHLGKKCVTMTYLMEILFISTELSDVMCEECSKSSGLINKSNFEKN